MTSTSLATELARCIPLSAAPERPEAASLAAHLLAELKPRLRHSACVAAQIDRVSDLVEPEWRAALKDAAWVHDVGYGETVAATGFHPLDGARWLRDRGWPSETCRLVAWHSESLEEARRRGLDTELIGEVAGPAQLAVAAVTWPDLTSSPNGDRWPVQRRLADILSRYPPGSVVHESTCTSLLALHRAVGTIEDLLACAA